MARVPYLRSLKVSFRSRVFTGIAAASAILASCIERSNPFDPINSSPKAAAEVIRLDRPALDSLTAGESDFSDFLNAVLVKYSNDSTANSDRAKDNALRKGSNLTTKTANAFVVSFNLNQPIKDSLRLKTEFVLLNPFKAYGPYDGFPENLAGLHFQAVSVRTHLTLVNAGNFPLLVYGPAFFDSVLAPFARDSVRFAEAQIRINNANDAIGDSNAVVYTYNLEREAENNLVRKYNDSIIYVKRIQNVVVIGRSDSLQAGASLAKAGDSLFLGPGTFNVDLRFNNTGTADSPIVVSGFPGRMTIIRPSLSGSDNSLVLGRDNRYIQFENLIFRGGKIGNVKLEGGTSDISFRNCVFDSSAGPGFEAYDSKFDMVDCEIRANGDVGVRLGGGVSQSGRLRFINVLIARNANAGLHSTSQLLDIWKCTLADNGAAGIQIISPLQEVKITNTLIAGNKGYGIQREATILNQEGLIMGENDLFGNEAGNWFLPNMDSTLTNKLISDNSSQDPVFIDAPAFNYDPSPGSLLDIFEKQVPPFIIGYRRPAP